MKDNKKIEQTFAIFIGCSSPARSEKTRRTIVAFSRSIQAREWPDRASDASFETVDRVGSGSTLSCNKETKLVKTRGRFHEMIYALRQTICAQLLRTFLLAQKLGARHKRSAYGENSIWNQFQDCWKPVFPNFDSGELLGFFYSSPNFQQMLKGPGLNLSVLHISVFQDSPNRGGGVKNVQKSYKICL